MRKLVAAGVGIALSLGVAAAGFAAEAATKTVTGALRDSFCWPVVGAHGPSHKKCAIECARKGIPVSLVEKGTDKVYILIPHKNARPLPNDIINNMENEVTVTGREFSKNGVTYLTVDSVK